MIPIIEMGVLNHLLRNGNTEMMAIHERHSSVIHITNFGKGIIESRLEKVKEKFYVGDTNYQGNGLGLYIADVSLNKLNAELMINSEPGNFTTVKMIFPQ